MDLGDLLGAMLAFFFWSMVIWVFTTALGDTSRRDDPSGWGKSGFILSEISGGELR